MLTEFRSARVIDAGYYEITGLGGGVDRYPWVDLLQRADDVPPELLRAYGVEGRDSTGVERYSVDKQSVAFDGIPFGALVSGVVETDTQTKVVKGTDRTVDQNKRKIVAWKLDDDVASLNGRRDESFETATA
jgi:hypothetical protein